MPRRRTRRRPPQHLYNIEPVPQPAPAPNWLTQLGNNIPMTFIVSAVVAVAVWFGTNNSKVEQLTATTPTVVAKIDDERKEREKVRDAFLASQAKTTEILGQISNRLAVSETKLEATNKSLDTSNQTLSKIADQLQQLNSRSGAGVR